MRLIKHPVLCNYYVTYRCNAACGFCDIWEKPSPYIQIEDVKANLRDLRALGVQVVDFTGGEPLLHQQLHLFLAEAKSLGFITTLTTNGLLYSKRADSLRGLVDMLHFSLDSVDADKHNASRKVDCFDHLHKGIAIALEMGEKPDILFTVTPNNLDELDAAYSRYVEEMGLMLILNPIFEYNGVGESLGKSQMDMLRPWGHRPGVYLNTAFLDLRSTGGNHIDKPNCKAGSSTIVISPENKLVLPCYHLGLEEIPIDGKLHQLWKSEAVQSKVRLEGRAPGCEGCVINCYMEPSMAVEMNTFWWKSIRSTLRYSLQKWVYA